MHLALAQRISVQRQAALQRPHALYQRGHGHLLLRAPLTSELVSCRRPQPAAAAGGLPPSLSVALQESLTRLFRCLAW
jgi:hypothetical protein